MGQVKPTPLAPSRRLALLNHATFIWNAADILRGTYKQHQYGDVRDCCTSR